MIHLLQLLTQYTSITNVKKHQYVTPLLKIYFLKRKRKPD